MPNHTLYILVEGSTEREIVKPFLKPYWEKRFARCEVINLSGSGNLKGKYVKETQRILSKPDHAVLILIDIKNDPFGVQSTTATHADAYHRLRELLYAGLGMSESVSLGIFPAVIEPETWLLADPNIQKTYLPKIYSHPENEPNPADIIEKHIRGYRKGISARKFFDKADALDVYDDNCPHFVFLADWLQGLPSKTSQSSKFRPMSASQRELMVDLQGRYDELTQRIEKSLKQGQTAAAGLLKADRNYIEQQIRELSLQLNDSDADGV